MQRDTHTQLLFDYAQNIINKRLRAKGKYIDEKDKVYVIYARKSTKDAERQERSIPDQIEDCQYIAKSLGITPVKIFQEKESAKVSGKRPLFDEMIAGIKSEKWNSIISWHPNRLARNMKEAGEIIDLIDRGYIKGLNFHQYTFTHDPNGVMMLGIQFVMAKQYSDQLSQSSTRGTSKIAKQGKAPTNKAKRGYTLIGRYYRPDGNNFELLQNAFQQAIEGQPLVKIAEYLNNEKFRYQGNIRKVTKQTLSNIFKDPFYAGAYIFSDELVDMSATDSLFERMVTPLEFLKLRTVLDKSTAFKSVRTKSILFRKMVYCGYCNNFMSPGKPRSSGKSRFRYYELRCTSMNCETKNDQSKARGIRGKVIIDYIYSVLKDGLQVKKEAYTQYINAAKPTLESSLKDQNQQLTHVKRQISEIDATMSEQRKSLANAKGETIDELNNEIDKLRENKDLLKEKQKELETKIIELDHGIQSQLMSYEDFLNFFKNIGNTIKNSDNLLLIDNAIRMVFLNFTVKDKKVLKYQSNPNIENLIILPSVNDCRG